eukprot:211621-Pleurochrysis_carterae.AAC.1
MHVHEQCSGPSAASFSNHGHLQQADLLEQLMEESAMPQQDDTGSGSVQHACEPHRQLFVYKKAGEWDYYPCYELAHAVELVHTHTVELTRFTPREWCVHTQMKRRARTGLDRRTRMLGALGHSLARR